MLTFHGMHQLIMIFLWSDFNRSSVGSNNITWPGPDFETRNATSHDVWYGKLYSEIRFMLCRHFADVGAEKIYKKKI